MPTPAPIANAPAPPPVHDIPAPLYWVTKLIQIPLMAAATALFGSISLVCGLWDRSGRQQHAVAHAWAGVMVRIALSPVEVINLSSSGAPFMERNSGAPASGLGSLGSSDMSGKQNQAAVYASNHLSYMDTPVLFSRLPFQFRILAKQSLWKLPFVGWYLNRSGQVPIDASSSRSAIAGLLRGVAALKSGMPLVVFPEGSRSLSGRLNPMASGAAFMAIRAQVPLVPVALVGTYELLPMHVYALRPRPLKVVIGEPIPTTGLTTRDADALTTQLYAAIERMYYSHTQ
ncbi:MAG TPA: lysophospholipid acyltransferase family protein [Acidobacteriaceae bacterium]|nr:lysophospholipid acyltransferase family protein [Acidobacteriaceae bacterium]